MFPTTRRRGTSRSTPLPSGPATVRASVRFPTAAAYTPAPHTASTSRPAASAIRPASSARSTAPSPSFTTARTARPYARPPLTDTNSASGCTPRATAAASTAWTSGPSATFASSNTASLGSTSRSPVRGSNPAINARAASNWPSSSTEPATMPTSASPRPVHTNGRSEPSA